MTVTDRQRRHYPSPAVTFPPLYPPIYTGDAVTVMLLSTVRPYLPVRSVLPVVTPRAELSLAAPCRATPRATAQLLPLGRRGFRAHLVSAGYGYRVFSRPGPSRFAGKRSRVPGKYACNRAATRPNSLNYFHGLPIDPETSNLLFSLPGVVVIQRLMQTEIDNSKLYRPREFNSLSKTRFFRDRRKRLLQHIGGRPDARQAVTIDRCISIEWSILRLQARMDAGDISEHAARELLAFHNHLRLLMRSLGPAAAAKGPDLRSYLAENYGGATTEAA